MPLKKADLGALESVHEISPVFLQRAAVVAALSFVFFLAMIFVFYLRQNILYFLLATAFLIVEIFTLVGWYMQRGTKLKLFEKGFTFKKQVCGWNEIESVSLATAKQKVRCEIKKTGGERIVLTEMIEGIDQIVKRIETEMAGRGK